MQFCVSACAYICGSDWPIPLLRFHTALGTASVLLAMLRDEEFERLDLGSG